MACAHDFSGRITPSIHRASLGSSSYFGGGERQDAGKESFQGIDYHSRMGQQKSERQRDLGPRLDL